MTYIGVIKNLLFTVIAFVAIYSLYLYFVKSSIVVYPQRLENAINCDESTLYYNLKLDSLYKIDWSLLDSII